MDIILLERVARLGGVGDVVTVKDGFARNYLLPQKKALRATANNKAVFESKRATLEAQNAEARGLAEKRAAGLQNLTAKVIRQASEDGKLYGSVTVRDIAEALAEAGHDIERRLIDMSTAIKQLGVYDAIINLHPEVPVKFRVHVARNAESPLPEELQENKAEPVVAEEEAA
jgi:large subunit ribosomal protein L9